MVSTSSTVSPTTAACSSTYNSGLDKYSITFTGIYPTTSIQTYLWIKVKLY